uniref:Uncharacterized protein n=1 Tax=virus sp. ctBM815 TaxID=2825806 RepID=A0A8S5RJQ4_9VIRU|nr:MAG TPA: hypothetical protein [virus sp. ctBM815]DAV23967.1 MAG TPA: hypothetical protein [Bacteriophage sp.]
MFFCRRHLYLIELLSVYHYHTQSYYTVHISYTIVLYKLFY